jgi:hypothetical protein
MRLKKRHFNYTQRDNNNNNNNNNTLSTVTKTEILNLFLF